MNTDLRLARYFAAVLSVIAVGLLLIAYGLLSPRVPVADAAMLTQPGATDVNTAPGFVQDLTPPAAQRADIAYRVASTATSAPVVTQPVAYQRTPARVERSSGRNWAKTALVIGGSTAAGAGLGGIFGGKKGALIGAAIGGGASTLFESQRR
ncbi:MAG TPA: hypothetical protein VH583_16635 [Vicinamibacterales bacterium]|jgi:hypothetical protein